MSRGKPEKYLDIAKRIQQYIRINAFPNGTMLPSERTLSEKYSCNHLTLRKALRQLEQKGQIYKIPSVGNFAGPRPEEPDATDLIGIIFPDDDLYYYRLLIKLESVFSRFHLFPIVKLTNNAAVKEDETLDFFRNKKVRAVISVPNVLCAKQYEKMHCPVIFFDLYPENTQLPHVISDDFSGAYSATDYLCSLGHTKIAYIGSMLDRASEKRYEGYLAGLSRNRIRREKKYPGSAEKIFHDPKFRSMGDFGALMVINGRDHVVSADCGHIMNDGIHAGVIYDFGNAIGSDQLRTFALNRMQTDPRRRQVTPAEATVCRFGTGEHLVSLLDTFFKLPAVPNKVPHAKLPSVSLWPGRMGIIRSKGGFSAALKGGDNGEFHNHNDLGHFTLYYGSRPLVIDLGTGMYSRKNFSGERYQLYYTNATGHNALCFGKNIQLAGREFSAGLTMSDRKTLEADLSKAYPPETGIQKYIRTVHCEKTKAVITDSVERKTKTGAVFMLYSIEDVRKCADGSLDFGNGIRCTVRGAVCTTIEPVALEDIPRHWGSRLCRILFKTNKPESGLTFSGPAD